MIEDEVRRILNPFYLHMCGVDDYGCAACLEHEKKFVDLIENKCTEAREPTLDVKKLKNCLFEAIKTIKRIEDNQK